MNEGNTEQLKSQSSSKEKAAVELSRFLSGIPDLKDKLISAIRVPARKIALVYYDRLVNGLEKVAVMARVELGDENLATTLLAASNQLKDLPISETLFVSPGEKLRPENERNKDLELAEKDRDEKLSKDRDELANLVVNIFASFPATYEVKSNAKPANPGPAPAVETPMPVTSPAPALTPAPAAEMPTPPVAETPVPTSEPSVVAEQTVEISPPPTAVEAPTPQPMVEAPATSEATAIQAAAAPESTEEPATPETAPSPAKKLKGEELRTAVDEIADAFERKFEREEGKKEKKKSEEREKGKGEQKSGEKKKQTSSVTEGKMTVPPENAPSSTEVAKIAKSFEEVQTLDDLDDLLRAKEGQLEALGGKQEKTRQFSYADVAGFLKERAQEFADEARTGDKRRIIERFLSSFVDPEVRDAMRRAFVHRGWVKESPAAPPAPSSESQKQTIVARSSAPSARESKKAREGVSPYDPKVFRSAAREEGPEDFETRMRHIIATKGVRVAPPSAERPSSLAGVGFASTPEALAASIHRERALQETLIAGFDGGKFASANEAITKGIELIGKLRESLERQAAVAGDEIAPLARDENQKLETLLGRIAQIRGKRQKMSQKQLVDSLREILNFEGEPADAVEQRKHDVGETDLESSRPAAPVVPGAAKAPEKVTRVASPEASVAKPILEAPTFDVGKAMNVAGFLEFLAEAGNSGDNEAAVKKHFEAFAVKDAVVGRVAQLCDEKILRERGIELGKEGKEAVQAFLERQAQQKPEAIKKLAEKFERFEKLSADVKSLSDQLEPARQASVVATAEQARLTAEQQRLQHKKQVLELAEKTNRFWPTWKSLILRDATGWGWLSSISKDAREARREAHREMKAGSRGFEAFFTFGAGLNTRKLLAEHKLVSDSITAIGPRLAESATKAGLFAQIEAGKQAGERLLEEAKNSLSMDVTMTDELVAIANKKLNEKLTEVWNKGAGADLDEAQRVFTLFEKAEDVYKKNPAGNKHLEGINVAAGMAAIETVIEESVGRQIEQAFADNEKITSGRFSVLENVLDGFVAKGKLGKKDKLAIRRFIILVLNKELDDLGREEKTVSPKAILIKTLIVRQIKKINEENPPPPPLPPTPPSSQSSPQALPVSPVALAAEAAPASAPAAKETVPETSPVSTHLFQANHVNWVVSSKQENYESVYAPQIPEEIKKLTFNDVLTKVEIPVLQKTVSAMPTEDLALVLLAELPDVIDKVRGCLSEGKQQELDSFLVKRRGDIITDPYMSNLRGRILKKAQEVLAEETTKPADSSAVEDIHSLETEGAAPISRKGPPSGADDKKVERETIGEVRVEERESLSTAGKIGEVFTRFCCEHTEWRLDVLMEKFAQEIPGATVKEIYRDGEAETIYFTDEKAANPQPYWLVTVEGKHYLLPKAIGKDRFDDANNPKGFSLCKDLGPATLEKMVPAEVVGDGQHWEIKTPGWFNEPPQESSGSMA